MSLSATPVVVRVRGLGALAVTVAVIAVLTSAASGCSDGTSTEQGVAAADVSETTATATVVLDPAFPGDAFDAACAVLDESSAADPLDAVGEVLDALETIGGAEAAATTLRTAVDDRCPEWSDAVEQVLGS